MSKHNRLDPQYKELLEYIENFGNIKSDRTGTGTKSIFGWEIRHKMSTGFPLLTTKKMYMRGIVVELLWFLRGDTNIRYLVQNNCNIWNGDAYKRYLETYTLSSNGASFKDYNPENGPWDMENFVRLIKEDDWFANMHGDLGPIYGKQWRKWFYGDWWMNGSRPMVNSKNIDQIANVIKDLRENPDSRRIMVNAWNVGEVEKAVLPPCHYGFQFYTRLLTEDEKLEWFNKNGGTAIIEEKNKHIKAQSYAEAAKWRDLERDLKAICPTRALSLMWNQRSVDTFLGLPFNIASYGLLLSIIAKEVNMIPDELIGHLGDTHLYLNHLEQAKEQISRTPYELPELEISDTFDFNNLQIDDFKIVGYKSHNTIKADLSN